MSNEMKDWLIDESWNRGFIAALKWAKALTVYRNITKTHLQFSFEEELDKKIKEYQGEEE